MKVFGEVKVPCEYMPEELPYDFLQHRVVDEIVKEFIRIGAIKFTEEYTQGYYIMRGDVEVEV